MSDSNSELEVHFKPESGKAVIEGKTTVPFQAFVALILQRKVTGLFKAWGKQPVIMDSELLTSLASAPQESAENRANLILVSMLTGILIGVVGFAAVQAVLLFVEVPLSLNDLGIIIGSVVVVVFLLGIMMKSRQKPKSEKLVETMEHVAGFLGKK